MSDAAFRFVALVLCLAGLACGCRVPSGPGHAPSSPGLGSSPPESSDHEGWLWKRMTQPAAPQDPSGDVRQASATEPAAAEPSRAKETVIGGAGAVPVKPGLEDDDKEFDISNYAPEKLYKRIKAAAGYGPDERIARQAFEEGQKLFDEKKYEEAAKKFATAADRWPDTPLEEDAMFLLGESYFFSDQYSKADDTYEKLLKKYTYSRYVDKAVARQFAVGRFWEQFDKAEPHWAITPNFTDRTRPLFDTWGHAIKAYEHVRLNDPTGPLADDSLMVTGNAYLAIGRYEDAAFEYDTLRKEYPKSEHAMNASLLCLDCKQRIYQGPFYDGGPLKDAGEVADQTLTRYGPALGQKRDLVIQAKNQIVEQKAQREWSIGQFYDRKEYYAAARYYYQSVVDAYPQTQHAQMARERIEQIKALPDRPPNNFDWLDKIVNPKKHRRRGMDGAAAAPSVAGSGGG